MANLIHVGVNQEISQPRLAGFGAGMDPQSPYCRVFIGLKRSFIRLPIASIRKAARIPALSQGGVAEESDGR